ncbi:MAG: DUF1799 domain-containing protein [Sterolibacterium sp.]|nr:DUF1799 domain-containing protein [Sterolibacterium sp.]
MGPRKKLAGLARAWGELRAGRGGDEFASDLAAFGVTEKKADSGVLDIWPENVDTWETFRALETNWRIIAGGMAEPRYQGIEYASIPEALRMAGVKKKKQPAVRAGLRIMERAALAAINGLDQNE